MSDSNGGAIEPRQSLERAARLPDASREKLEQPLSLEVGGLYLGAVGSGRFRDEVETPVEDIGIKFGVVQNSAGYTGIYAKPLEGYVVESLNPDASSRKTMWQGPEEWREDSRVTVNSDWGKMGLRIPIEDWSRTNFGSPGTRSGIIRVTDPNGTVKHFLMAGEFKGRPDSWRVSGEILEVHPSDSFILPPTSKRALAAVSVDSSVADPSLANGNLVNTLTIDSNTVRDLTTAFNRITPYIEVLHAPNHIAREAGMYANLSLALLLEFAQSHPELLDGQELEIDELGRRARLLSHSSRDNSGFINNIDDEDEARVAYLTNVIEFTNRYQPNSDSAHHFSLITSQAMSILGKCLAAGKSAGIAADSELANKIRDIIAQDHAETAEIKAKRAKVLEGTIFDTDRKREGIDYRVAIPGQVLEIDLNTDKPLLSSDQTYEAFYADSHYIGDDGSKEGFVGPVIAILELKGKKYAVMDNRESKHNSRSGLRSKVGNTNSWNDMRGIVGEIKLLQILDDKEDPRLGLRVLSQDMDFDRYDYGRVEPIRDFSDRDEKGYINKTAETGITIEFNSKGKLIIDGFNVKVAATASKDAIAAHSRPLALRPGRGTDIEQINATRQAEVAKRRKIVEWEEAVESVQTQTAALRERLERPLKEDIEKGRISQEKATEWQNRIDEQVARGPARSRTYNGFTGDKWHRAQTYYVTVDSQGNIWGDFEPGRNEIGITGKPVSPGRHIMMRNPNLKQ